MNRDEIIAAIDDFLDLIEVGKESVEANESALALAYHFSHSTDIKADRPDPPRLDYNEMRDKVVRRFPDYDYYNLPSEIGESIAQTGIMVGDAIDDIADIALDMHRVKWRLDNTDIDDALWHFRLGYEAHWGNHLRQLQLYLHDRNFNYR